MKHGVNKIVVVLASLGLLLSGAFAQSPSDPDQQIRTVIGEMVSNISKDTHLVKSRTKIYELVKTKMLPLFDSERITARSVGRDWLSASDEQKKALIENFSDILMLTYSNALVGRDDLAKDMEITWGRSEIDEKRAIVRSTLSATGGKHQIDYAMRKGKDGWKLDDITVNNLSIFNAYRDQFISIIKNSGGLDGLISKLVEDRAKLLK